VLLKQLQNVLSNRWLNQPSADRLLVVRLNHHNGIEVGVCCPNDRPS
jgi:hypothetical protein